MKNKESIENVSFPQRLLDLVSDPNFIKISNILNEPNFLNIVGRSHFERWHSTFLGWLLDPNGSHLMYDYVLQRFLSVIHDRKCLKSSYHDKNTLTEILPIIEFKNTEVTPNEFLSTELSVKGVGRFDIFLTTDYSSNLGHKGKLNILFEIKIDSKVNSAQSKKYADWLLKNHKDDLNILVYILPKVFSDSKSTIGDSRWYCLDFQLLNDKLLQILPNHPNLNPKVEIFILQYIKNLRNRHKGMKMAITQDERQLAIELYEKYSDVFDSIFDALQSENILDYSTSDISSKGRKSGRIAVKIDSKIFEGGMVRDLFKKVLKYLVDQKLIDKIPLPWGTGKTRYIITNEIDPMHPNGRNFFYPESYKSYTIETHYGRDRALSVLDALCKKLEILFEPIEV